jgi:hypothetical protein
VTGSGGRRKSIHGGLGSINQPQAVPMPISN